MTHALSAALAATAPTMSSKEIADRTGKRHDNVMADVRKMLTELHGDGAPLKFQESYRAGNGKMEPCYILPKHECLVLVTGYSIPMRAAVVARWQELEAQVAAPALPDFTDPAAAARAWAERFEGERRALAARRRSGPFASPPRRRRRPLSRLLRWALLSNPQPTRQDNVAYSELAAAKLR